MSCSRVLTPRMIARLVSIRGFTLIELMIVLTVAGVLAAVALPVYLDQVRKGRRSDAVAALSSIQQAQERWRANSPSYADRLDTLGFVGTNSPKGYYELSLSDVSAAGYTVTASVVSGRAQAGDTQCARMWVTLRGGDLRYQSSNPGCWSE